eukprot:m.85128 g.85128  ORF g.85128 m.85128 type:complete len:254 (-) comp12997_c0_seq2:1300-2061(-)
MSGCDDKKCDCSSTGFAKRLEVVSAHVAARDKRVAERRGKRKLQIDPSPLRDELDADEALSAIHRASAKLPTRFGNFTIHAYECPYEYADTAALVKGDVRGMEDVPVRLHSACFTGDLMGSLRCDCRQQLEKALSYIGELDCGVVIYLQQEGRGIGLVNKIKAYALQDSGDDTVEANHKLGFEDDLRTYEVGADILKSLGVQSVRLVTNNPKKKEGLESNGVTVSAMQPLLTVPNPHNSFYLETKKLKSGHIL